MSQLNQAMHDLVHKSDMSTTEISEKLGISRQILTNKVNPENEYNKLTVHELHAISILTGNDVVLRAMQGEFVLATLQHAPESILEAMIANGKECGDVFSVVQEAMKDNRLTERERASILKEISEAIASLERTALAVRAHGNPNYQRA